MFYFFLSSVAALRYTLRHKESGKCLTYDYDLGDCNDLFQIEYSFERRGFMISPDEGKFVDFNYQEPTEGLRTTSSEKKAKMYLMPRGKSRTQFIFADCKDKRKANYMVAVDDGEKPSIWIGADSPYDDSSNIDNFTWVL